MTKINTKKQLPLHISQAFDLKIKEGDLDFFDANLEYDSRLFIDPFLLRISKIEEERMLFGRFGDFFRYVYDQSINIRTDTQEYNNLLELLDFSEPKELCLGYTEDSSDGSSPGKSFAHILIKFFLNSSARRLVKEDNLYPDKKFNPVTIEIFTRKLGMDGLSDISANLIMDYLINYTQKQCKKLEIPTKENMAVDADGFNFDPNEMEWKKGGHYKLPENPLRLGKAIIFVPKRLLRASALERANEYMVNKVIGILNNNIDLCKKFSKLLEKEVDKFNVEDIRKVMLEDESIFKKYLHSLYEEDRDSYDFDKDPLAFLAYKKYSHLFSGQEKNNNIKNEEEVFKITTKFIEEVVKHLSTTDIWRDMWKWNKDNKIVEPNTEKVFQRIVFAMGKCYFIHYPQITFEPEVGTGNGPVDFKVIFLNCRIAIELKRLLSSSYLDGIKSQLPEYSMLANTSYAIYVTAQHYTARHPRSNNKTDNGRILEIEESLTEIEKNIKKGHEKFKKLVYYNIDVSPKPSASKKHN